MQKKLFEGVATALVTPFKENTFFINYEQFEKNLEFQIKEGIDALVVCGTTGEASTLSKDEQKELIHFTLEKVAGRVPIIVGTGSNNTQDAIFMSRFAQDAGASAVLVVTPYYNKTSQQGLIEHYTAIAKSIDIPIILYNVPTRTGVNLEPQTIEKLSHIEHIQAIKECNLSQMLDVITRCSDRLWVYTGNDPEILPSLSLGAHGIISVTSNILVRETRQIVSSFLSNNIKEALAMQMHIHPMNQALFCDINPMPIKAAMNLMGIPVGPCRLPLVSVDSTKLALIQKTVMEFATSI